MNQKIIVLDFGGQFNQLIARRVRELEVYCEVLPYSAPVESFAGEGLAGIILTGGPADLHSDGAPTLNPAVLKLNVPILGICYGHQALAHALGGETQAGKSGEYGKAELTASNHRLFKRVAEHSTVWMNHRNHVSRLPEGFTAVATTADCRVAAMADDARGFFGMQFHPEVEHSQYGTQMLKNFLYDICNCDGGYDAGDMIDTMVEDIKRTAGNAKVLSALSGGVDSSVASVLVHKAVGDNLTCIFVDHGLLRKGEAEQVVQTYRDTLGLNLIHVDASERFLTKLAGVVDPERKRKIIGEEFIRVFEEEADKVGGDYLVQGTIYPDIIESGSGDAATIKSHHNVGGLPEDIRFKGLIEPLKLLFKDEVRVLGERMGIPAQLVWRQPFPGPGLAIRVVGEITREKLDCLRDADAIVREEIENAGLGKAVWQYFAVHTGVNTVGVMGDERTYNQCMAIRAITTTDAMTAEVAELPYALLSRMATRIVNEVSGVNRVVYDITSKPPGTIEWE